MPKTQENGQQGTKMDAHRNVACGPVLHNWNNWKIGSVGNSMFSYGKSRSRVSVRGIGRSYARGCFCISSEVLSVNGPVLISTRPHSAPTTDKPTIGFKGKNKFGIRVSDISPVDNNGSEWIFNSNTNIGKENHRSMQKAINHRNKEQHESDRRCLLNGKTVSIDQDRCDHARTKNVANRAVKVSSTGSKEFGITASLSQFFEGGSRHE